VTILANTVTLSLDRYPIEPEENQILEYINGIATWIFIGEMGIKILGMGLLSYA
jgi:hypothetical protein